MGSGKHLNRSIKKYGLELFKKEILFVFKSEEEMNNKEKELVNEEYCKRTDTYNICPGGFGGFGYINKQPFMKEIRTKIALTKFTKEIRSANGKKTIDQIRKLRYNFGVSFLGKKHTIETINKMKQSAIGKHIGIKNSQYGSCWITNEIEDKKIKKEELDGWINLGYRKGRKFAKRNI